MGTSAYGATLRRTLGIVAFAVLGLAAATLGAFLAPRAVGYETLVVLGSSMGDAYPMGSLVTVRPVPAGDVRIGDVILIRNPGSPAVLHRVVEKHSENGTILVETKGDANATRDPGDTVLSDKALVATWNVPKLGYALKWAHTPRGWLLLQAFPASLIAAWLILRVWWEDDWAPGTLSLRRGYA